MITIVRIEGGSNSGNRRCATSSSTAPSVDRHVDDDNDDNDNDDDDFDNDDVDDGCNAPSEDSQLVNSPCTYDTLVTGLSHSISIRKTGLHNAQVLRRHPQLQLRQCEPVNDCHVSPIFSKGRHATYLQNPIHNRHHQGRFCNLQNISHGIHNQHL